MREFLLNNFDLSSHITILNSDDFLINKLSLMKLSSDEVILRYRVFSNKTSKQIKEYILKILSKYNVIVFDNVLCLLNSLDKKEVLNNIKKYKGIFINISNNIEESLFFKRIVIIYNKKIICEGKTLSVLNEEKLMKRLGYSMPFIILLNKYLMDYNIIDRFYLNNESLVDNIWK